MKRPKLRLVGKGESGKGQSGDGAGSIFDDMDALRTVFAPTVAATDATTRAGPGPLRRPRATETFARIPHDRALKLYRRRISPAGWHVLFELDHMIIAQRGKNPVIFWSPRLQKAGMRRNTKTQALRQLEAAGVIEVEWRESGLGPLVRHLWYPRRD